MSNIDERVVSMQFNNKQFESGVQTTMTSIADLKSSLNFDGATKGLDDLGGKMKGFSLEGIASAVDGIAQKFGALGIAGVTAIANITNKAVDAGIRMAKELSLDPITDGFAEYELKMGSIQTILANTAKDGTKLKDVTKSLNELNHYADQTIYNFGDMTKNIGLFTNAGIGLQDATDMIKGFSNEAAASGTSAEGAAGAAYQLSQALSAGTIRLMDWRSLSNVGMGNKNMQNGLIEIASAMGTFNKKTTTAKAAADDFNGSLEKQWLSADVMSTYLKIQAGELSDAQMKSIGLTGKQIKAFGAQQQRAEDAATKVRTWTQLFGTLKEAVGSSWTDSFDIIVGNFDEATTLFTNISNKVGGVIGTMGDARNKMLRGWKKLGGRDDLMNIGKNIWTSISNIIKPVKDAFEKMFPADGGKGLKSFTQGLENLSGFAVKLTSGLTKLQPLFEALFGVFKLGFSIVKGVFSLLGNLFGLVSGGGTAGIFGLVGAVAALINQLVQWVNQGQYIEKFFETLSGYQSSVLAPISDFIGRIGAAFTLLAQGDTSGFFDGIKNSVQAFAPLLDTISQKLGVVGEWFGAVGTTAAEFGSKATGPLAAVGSALATAGAYLKNFFGNLSGAGDKLVSTFETVRSATSGVGDGLEKVGHTGDTVNAIWQNIANAFKSVGQWLKPVIDGLGQFFGWVGGQIKRFINDLSGQDALALINTGLFMAAYLAVKKFMDSFRTLFDGAAGTFESITKSIDGLTGVFSGMQQNLKADSLQKLGIAIGILAAAIWVLAQIDPQALGAATLAIGVLLVMLMQTMDQFAATANGTEVAKIIALGLALELVSGAILMLSAALLVFGHMDQDTLTQGLLALTAVLGVLTAALYGMSKAGPLTLETAAALAVLAIALNLLATTILIYAALPWDKVTDGIAKMGIVLGVLGTAMKLMPEKAMLKNAVALGLLGISLQILALAILTFSAMSPETVGRGLIAIGASLVVLAGGLTLMNGTMMGVLALAAAALALGLLVPVLVVLGNMSLESLVIALGAIAAVFLVFAGMAMLLTPVIPVMLALAIAVGVLGVGLLAAGAGMMLFASGMALMATAGAAGAVGLTAAFMAILNLLPLLFQQLGLAVVAFAKVISEAAPVLVAALIVLLENLINGLRKIIPQVIDLVYDLLTALVERISDFIPDVVNAGMDLIQGLLDGLNERLPDIIDSAGQLIVSFLDGLDEWIPQIIDAGSRLILDFLDGLDESIPQIVDSATQLITDFISGLDENLQQIIDAGTDLIVHFIEGIGNSSLEIVTAAMDTLTTFLEGLATAIRTDGPKIRQAGMDIASAILEGLTSGITSLAGNAFSAIGGIAHGLLDRAKSILGIHSPSKEFQKIGENINQGLYKGLTNGSRNDIIQYYRDMKADLKDLVQSTKTDVDQAEAKLKRLNDARTKDYKAINKATAEVKKAKEAAKDAADAYEEWTKGQKEHIKTLKEQAKEHDKVLKQLDKEEAKLDALKQQYKDYRKSIKEQYASLPDLYENDKHTKAINKAQASYDQLKQKSADATAAIVAAKQKMKDAAQAIKEQYDVLPDVDENTTVQSYVDKLKTDKEAILKFQQTLVALRSIGLDDETYKQLLAEGAGAQGFADQLLAGGPAAVAEIDKLNDELAAAAQGLGDNTSQELNQAAIDAARAVRDGIKAELQAAKQGLSDASANIVSDYVADIEAQAKKVRKLKKDLNQLRKMGLNDATYMDLLEKGPDSQAFVTALLESGQAGVDQVNDATKDLTSAAGSMGKAAADSLYKAGVDAAQGVVDGLKESEADITAEMERIAKKMVTAIKKELGIKSPSREFKKIAGYSTDGLIVGFRKTSASVEQAAADVGSASMDALKKSMSDSASLVSADMDTSPVIRPVLDLSAIQRDSGLINDIISPSALSIAPTLAKATAIAMERQSALQIDADNQIATDDASLQSAVTFIQNNSSPKALTPAEIYRQTKNQLSVVKGGLPR